MVIKVAVRQRPFGSAPRGCLQPLRQAGFAVRQQPFGFAQGQAELLSASRSGVAEREMLLSKVPILM